MKKIYYETPGKRKVRRHGDSFQYSSSDQSGVFPGTEHDYVGIVKPILLWGVLERR